MKWLLPAFTVFLLNSAFATDSDYVDERVRVRLVQSQYDATEDAVKVGVDFSLAPGWHIYWKNPGDSGNPPKIEWILPNGWKADQIEWPIPKRIPVSHLMNFGYEEKITFSSKLHLNNATENTTINANVEWLVCKEDCIPGRAELELKLDLNKQNSDQFHGSLANIFIELPATAMIEKDLLILNGKSATKEITDIEFFPFEKGIINNAGKQNFSFDQDNYILKIPLSNKLINLPSSISGLIIFSNKTSREGFMLTSTVSAPVTETMAVKNSPSMLIAIVLSLLGGIILNLMPCVFPVLSIKILGFINSAGENRKKIRLHGFIFALGIISSMLIVAGALLGLRAAGASIGWGFQLQSPAFIWILCVVFFALALNLLGVFEIGYIVQRHTANFKYNQQSLLGAFLNGCLATVVATPCTAPFMGSALAAALSMPTFNALLVFTALGVGLSLPYLALCFWPSLLSFLPKPGAWMETLKKILSIPLFATVIWLLWVLGQQSGVNQMAFSLILLLIIGNLFWIYGTSSKNTHLHLTFRTLSLLLVLALTAIPASYYFFNITPNLKNTESVSGSWEPYTEAKLNSLLAANTPVFIDFTAAWCVTCQVNKKIALENSSVITLFDSKGVKLLRADWTDVDPEVTKGLERLGRDSVPTNVLYIPQKEPVLFPSLLTPGIIRDIVQKNLP